MERRNFIKTAALGSAVLPGLLFSPYSCRSVNNTDTVRDRLWIWGHLEGSYDNQYGLPMNSRMTPLQGAEFLNIPNIIMVRYSNKPEPPYNAYAAQYRHVKKLMWRVGL